MGRNTMLRCNQMLNMSQIFVITKFLVAINFYCHNTELCKIELSVFINIHKKSFYLILKNNKKDNYKLVKL